jgi:hypothetical protein
MAYLTATEMRRLTGAQRRHKDAPDESGAGAVAGIEARAALRRRWIVASMRSGGARLPARAAHPGYHPWTNGWF